MPKLCAALVVLFVVGFDLTLQAQWVPQLPANVPRTADGRPDLSAPTPRTADGRPDLMDGRAVAKDPNPSWLGYSTGRWDGDALVVTTIGLNGKTWLDTSGHPTTEA